MKQLKIAFRNFKKKPAFTIITFSGFMLGIMASLLIYLWVHNELNYDKFHEDYSRIYRVLTLTKKADKIVKTPGSYRPLAQTLKNDFPQIEYATYISYSSETSPLQLEGSDHKIEAEMSWSVGDFFKIFTGFSFIEGNAETAFSDPSNIVISETLAHRLFGNEIAIGSTVISDKYSWTDVYKIGGVVRIPHNSTINFDYMASENNSRFAHLGNDWRDKGYNRTYIKLAKNAIIDEPFLSRISNQVSRYSRLTDKLMFQPLADIHLYSDYDRNRLDQNMSSIKYVWLFSGLALLILFMAIFNFSVLSVARASERTTEIGIKKVNGAGKAHFIQQFIGESVLQTFAAAVLGFILLWLLLPAFNQFTGKNIHLIFSYQLVFNLLLLILGTGILAGLYPSFVLSSLNPNRILQKGSVTGSPNRTLKILVTTQFVLAIAFVSSTTVFIKQINFIQQRDTGINHDNIVVVPTGLWYGNGAFKDDLMRNPNILGVSASVYAPIDFKWLSSFPLNQMGRTDSLHASLFWVDEDFAKTYNLQIVKGHFLDMDFSAYWKEWQKSNSNKNNSDAPTVSFPVVINEKAEEALGIDDPIGQRLGNYVIVGVVKDFNFRTAYHSIEPIILTNDPQNIMTMNIKISPYNKVETLKYIRDTYRKYKGNREFSYQFFDDMLTKEYQQEIFMKNISMLFTILAIIISALGILGISMFSIERRTKEIGIRKVNGATISEVLVLLNTGFIKWIAVAFLFATPIAWYAMHKWLVNFAYQTPVSWWIFALAGLLALGIALLTVSFQSWKAATKNPVEALRYE
ncbi:ABC transporter permease [Saccharicrinis sp. FJH62]|uniref:ABC transporter permease n=1 Tax=Saccharicrinis sp. FJH62 TaxID=3344657 RepID=UPI0035D44175